MVLDSCLSQQILGACVCEKHVGKDHSCRTDFYTCGNTSPGHLW